MRSRFVQPIALRVPNSLRLSRTEENIESDTMMVLGRTLDSPAAVGILKVDSAVSHDAWSAATEWWLGWMPIAARPEGSPMRALAYCWCGAAKGFPKEVAAAFAAAEETELQSMRLLFAFPEFQVHLPGGETASQCDLCVLARAELEQHVLIVEAQGEESLGPTVQEWLPPASLQKGKRERLAADRQAA